jgi:hypothetical protein
MKVVLVLRACEDVSPANVKNCAGLTLVLAFFLNLNSCQGTTCLGGEVTKNDDGDITLYAKNVLAFPPPCSTRNAYPIF